MKHKRTTLRGIGCVVRMNKDLYKGRVNGLKGRKVLVSWADDILKERKGKFKEQKLMYETVCKHDKHNIFSKLKGTDKYNGGCWYKVHIVLFFFSFF